MTRAARLSARSVVGEGVLLCETCGYVLAGLPVSSRCPECGEEIAASLPGLRRVAAIEDEGDGRWIGVRFLATTAAVLFWPRGFYRGLVTRRDSAEARGFAMVHYGLASMMMGGAVYLHLKWFAELLPNWPGGVLWAGISAGIFGSFYFTTLLAARLTHWEATYRGLRMPLSVVKRTLHFHSADYLLPAVVTLGTVWGYHMMLLKEMVSAVTVPNYLYTLCGLVILFALYLFKTYWTAMRQTMYANA